MEILVLFIVLGLIAFLVELWARTRPDPVQPDQNTEESALLEKVIGSAGTAYSKARAKSELDARAAKYDALAKLQALLQSGAISEQEFKAEKREILGR